MDAHTLEAARGGGDLRSARLQRYGELIAYPSDDSIEPFAAELSSLRLEATRRRIAAHLEVEGNADLATRLMSWGPAPYASWRPEVGLALSHLRAGNSSAAMLQLCIGLALGGLELDLEIQLPERLGVLVNGCWFALDEDVRVVSAAGFLEIIPASREPLRISTAQRSGDVVLDTTALYAIDFGGALSADAFPWPPRGYGEAAQLAPDHRMHEVVRQGMRRLVATVPGSSAWLRVGVSGLLIFDVAEGERFRSGSEFNLPGLIALSSNCDEIQVAECLIHECSHQFFNMLSVAAPLTNPKAREMSYSPIRDQMRPVGRVLLGAHAVANIYSFYKLLERGGRDAAVVRLAQERREYFYRWMLEDYVPALDASQSFTATGARFWEKLKSGLYE